MTVALTDYQRAQLALAEENVKLQKVMARPYSTEKFDVLVDQMGAVLKALQNFAEQTTIRLESAEKALEPFAAQARPNGSDNIEVVGIGMGDCRAARTHMENYHGR